MRDDLDDDVLDVDDEDGDDENLDSIYLKYCFEGASSLAELSKWLRSLADELEARAVAGWRMDHPVDSGWAHLVRDC